MFLFSNFSASFKKESYRMVEHCRSLSFCQIGISITSGVHFMRVTDCRTEIMQPFQLAVCVFAAQLCLSRDKCSKTLLVSDDLF